MAEDQTAEEERQDSEEHEAGEEENEQTQASTEGAEDSEGSEESEGGEEGNPEDERGEAGGKIGDVDIDEVDPDEPTQEDDVAAAQMRKLEKEGPPEALADWPTGKAMYLTFGGSEGGEGYEEGSPRQMGPSSLRHHPDGSVEVQGEMVDNPEDYKAEETVFEEHEKIGMDKGAKSGGEEEESGEDESGEDGASAKGDDSSRAESDGSSGDSEEGSEEEAEKAEAS